MAARKKQRKATKGKNGCLRPNGRLKKGWKWAKRRGYCAPAKGKKKAAKKGGKKRTAARRRRALPELPAAVRAAILTAPSAEEKYAQRGQFSAEELKDFGYMRRR